MGTLYVVATPIGNLNDVSKRCLETLKDVDLILCEDTRHSLKLLNYYNIKNKLVSYHKYNEQEKSKKIIKDIIENDISVAIISDAGTPCISDPGYEIVHEARMHNINVIGVSGPSAMVTALSTSGLKTDKFSFYGFFPRETKDKKQLITNIKNSDINTFVFYESPKRIINTLEYLKKELLNFKITISSDLTKLHEKTYYGSIDKVLTEIKDFDKNDLGEYTFIIETNIKTKEVKSDITLEAMLIDKIVKDNVSIKEAITLLSKDNINISKKDFYNASLNIKNLF